MKQFKWIAVLLLWGAVPAFSALTADPSDTPKMSDEAFTSPGTSTGTDPSLVSSPPASEPSSNWTRMRGTVTSIETTSNELHLINEYGNSSNVVVDDTVAIRKNGKTVLLADLQPGDHVLLINKAHSSKG